jgi:hypothetical protein
MLQAACYDLLARKTRLLMEPGADAYENRIHHREAIRKLVFAFCGELTPHAKLIAEIRCAQPMCFTPPETLALELLTAVARAKQEAAEIAAAEERRANA